MDDICKSKNIRSLILIEDYKIKMHAYHKEEVKNQQKQVISILRLIQVPSKMSNNEQKESLTGFRYLFQHNSSFVMQSVFINIICWTIIILTNNQADYRACIASNIPNFLCPLYLFPQPEFNFPKTSEFTILSFYKHMTYILASIIHFQSEHMTDRSAASKRKAAKQPTAKLNYCLKPRIVRNSPLNKYDLTVLQSTDVNSAEITDHFNYGFNSETFPVYAKLCKRFAEAEEIEHPNAPYDSNANNQFRFNDDAPIDLGGFGPFLDKQLCEVWQNDNWQGIDSLMSLFGHLLFLNQQSKKSVSPVEFLRLISDCNDKDNPNQFMNLLEEKINQKYERSMRILKRQEVNPVVVKQKIDSEQLSSTLPEEVKEVTFYDDLVQLSSKQAKVQNKDRKVLIKKEVKSEPEASSEDSIAYSSIAESAESEEENDNEAKCDKAKAKNGSESSSCKEKLKQSRENQDFSRKERADSKDHDSPYVKKQESEHRERSSHHKKKKSKSKKINKHKSHKKHKKHGKRSKKHRK